jgi:aldose 1-epimerase
LSSPRDNPHTEMCHVKKKGIDADLALLTMVVISCAPYKIEEKVKSDFYTIRNSQKMEALFTSIGAKIVSLTVPDKNGNPTNIAVGFNNEHQYSKRFRTEIGKYSTGIMKGGFIQKEKDPQLAINDVQTLLPGMQGFQLKEWNVVKQDEHTLIFTYPSDDGKGDSPMNSTVKVSYTLTEANELKIKYNANIDQSADVYLTNQFFFNLNGEGSGTIGKHLLLIGADYFIPVDTNLISMEQPVPVKGSPFDFTKPTAIGVRINDNNDQLKNARGYNHNFVLNRHSRRTPVARVLGDKSGIIMQVYTDLSCIKFCTGNAMQSENQMRNYNCNFRAAFCLKTQHFPLPANHPDVLSAVLKPGNCYSSLTIYQFALTG